MANILSAVQATLYNILARRLEEDAYCAVTLVELVQSATVAWTKFHGLVSKSKRASFFETAVE